MGGSAATAGVVEAGGAGGQVVADRAGGHAAQVEGDGGQAPFQAGPEQVRRRPAGRWPSGQPHPGQLAGQAECLGGQLGGGQRDLGGVGPGRLGRLAAPGSPSVA